MVAINDKSKNLRYLDFHFISINIFFGRRNNETFFKIHLLSLCVKNILLIIIFTSFQGGFWNAHTRPRDFAKSFWDQR